MDPATTYKKTSIVIIDDEERNRDLLRHLIGKHNPEATIVGEAESVDQGFDVIKSTNPDLVLLDISMPPYNGFDLLKLFDQISFGIIFITAYSEYAIQAIKYSALDYILKPVKADELKQAINRFQEKSHQTTNLQYQLLREPVQHSNKPQKLFIHSFQAHSVIQISDILYLQSSGNYTEFYFANSPKLISSRPIKQYEELLQNHQFYRVHKSYVINMNHVQAIHTVDGGEVILTGNVAVPIAHRRMELFMRVMQSSL